MSQPRELIVIGGGEHARVVIEAARSRSDLWNVVGFVDGQPCPETAARLRVRQFASDDKALRQAATAFFVLGIARIGSAELRRGIVTRFTKAGARWGTVVHRAAVVSETAWLGEGTVILATAVVNSGAVIGAHGVVNTAAVIEHDVKFGDFALAAPGAIVGGGAEIGADCYLGLGSRVRDHVSVGRAALIGMGAVVVESVAAGLEVIGMPARARAKKEYVAGT